MGIPELTKSELVAAIRAVGIGASDGVLVHSALQFLGRPAGGEGIYWESLLEVIGPEGTVAVPTFNFAFARGDDYDSANTPSDGMGVFSEWVRKQPEARRTSHPMQSLAVMGTYATDLAGRDTPSAFDDGSAFDRMLELDFKLLLLGADAQAVSMVHYSEQRAGVPYRYWKEFTGQVKTADGWETRTYRMFVRDLERDPQLKLAPIQEALEARGQWSAVRVNYGWVSACGLRNFVDATDALLKADPWALVGNKAEVAGEH